jgi:rod shape-determining protein MreB and related proteins
MTTPAVFVGMDFGSFKTSVVASNGRRQTMHTVVGWAKDHVSRAMLGCDVLVGKHVFEQRLALNIVRPFEKGQLKYSTTSDTPEQTARRKEAASLIVQEAVKGLEIPAGAKIYGVVGAPSRAGNDCRKIITEAIGQCFDAVMIVAEPFAVAFGMGRLTETLVVDIGAGTTDICPVFGTYPADEDQITIPLGGDAIDEVFLTMVRAKYPDVQISLNMARQIKEKYSFVHDVNESAIVSLPVNGRPTMIDVTEPLCEACKTIVNPIVEGIQGAVRRFDPEFQRPLLNNILLGGGGSCLKGLDHLIEEALRPYGGGRVTKAYDSVFAGADGALKLAMNIPESHWTELKNATAPVPKMIKSAA